MFMNSSYSVTPEYASVYSGIYIFVLINIENNQIKMKLV